MSYEFDTEGRRIDGWKHDTEDFLALRSSLRPTHELRLLRSQDFQLPESMDIRPWHRIENQGQMGSCVGSSGSSIGEMCLKIASGDTTSQFSKYWCYRQAQIKGGISGDSGAMLDDMLWVAKTLGFAKESTVPYPSSYTSTIPNRAAAELEAKGFMIRTGVDIQTYDDALQFLGMGLGGIQIGIQWPGSWSNTSGYLTTYPGGRGGHALYVGGYLAEKDKDGYKWLIMPNTWGPQWGDKGFGYLSKKCWDQMSNSSYFQAIGYSDMLTLEPRMPKFLL